MNEQRYRESERRLWASFGLSPAEERLQLRRTGATVRVLEVGQGPPVLFVHGASNAGSSWAPLAARMTGYRCLMVDRPGCGLSDPLPYRLRDVGALAQFAEALIVDVLDALQVETAPVVATSFGGYIGFRSAMAHPGRISSLTALGWPVGAPVGRVPMAMRLAGAPVLGRLLVALPPNMNSVKAMLRSIGLRRALEEDKVSRESLAWFLSLLRDTKTMRNELDTTPPVISLSGRLNEDLLLPENELACLSMPVLLLWGDEDVFGGAGVARAFATQVPGGRLELMTGAGHALWLDYPELVASSITAFLSANGAPACVLRATTGPEPRSTAAASRPEEAGDAR